jgi:hypothetical protein
MNLVFLCGSLEPGRDGVGDYTQALARACAAKGHVCRLAAFADKHLPASAPEETPTRLRLPAALSWTDRARRLHRWLSAAPSDWVSWQLVPYSLHPKGIVPAATRHALAGVARAGPGRHHVMLHELWIGLSTREPWRARLTGWLQRRAWCALLRALAPHLVHTSNPAYVEVLRSAGLAAHQLPLPGNVPIASTTPEAARANVARALHGALPTQPPPLIAVVFGTVHPQWNPQPTLAWLRDAGTALGRPPALLFVGRLGAHGERLVARLRADPSHGVLCAAAGERPASEVSEWLQAADCGVGLHPWTLIGKSAAVTDLLEHGLPVLVPRDDWQLRVGPTPPPMPHPRLARLADVPPARAAAFFALREAPQSRLDAIADAFLAALTAAAGDPARSRHSSIA